MKNSDSLKDIPDIIERDYSSFENEEVDNAYLESDEVTSDKPSYKDSKKNIASGGAIFASILSILLASGLALAFCAYLGLGFFAPIVDENTKVISLSDVSVDNTFTEQTSFQLTSSSFDAVPSSDGITLFTLSDLTVPDITSSELNEIEVAFSAIKETADAAFIIIDAQTGRGICYNPTAQIYAESSLVAPYALYVCQKILDPEHVSTGALVDQLSTCITTSNRETFATVRNLYDDKGWSDFLTKINAIELASSGSVYGSYSPLALLRCWEQIYEYTNSDALNAGFLSEQLTKSDPGYLCSIFTSDFNATTLSKGGYYPDASATAKSLCDTGIVSFDGHTYFVSVLTNMEQSDENVIKLKNLFVALFNARSELNLQELTQTVITAANGEKTTVVTNKNGTTISQS